jgi:dienelactone hydrolase
MVSSRALALLAVLAPLAAAGSALAQDFTVGTTGLQRDMLLTDYSPLSSNLEMLRRFASPFDARTALQDLARSGKRMAEQPVTLEEERFTVYIPTNMPPDGYGLLVFVSPSDQPGLPQGWAEALDRFGVIFVSAARSGNRQNTRTRREPLALLAAENLRRLYKVDPHHIWVGGFSGGSQVAMLLALGYPDLFHGALLDAGSDEIGSAERPLPPRQLFQQFQESSRLIYVTGADDAINLALDRSSRRSMQDWCVFALDTETTPWQGHQVIGAASLSQALEQLSMPVDPDWDRLLACRSTIEAELNTQFDRVAALLVRHQSDRAREVLSDIDRRFGGLAAPRSLEILGP